MNLWKKHREGLNVQFCIGLALLISILSKIKRHFSGTAEGGNRHTMGRCVQSTGKATLHQLRHENWRVARQAKPRPGAVCTWPQRSVWQSWELSPSLPAQGLSPIHQPTTVSTEETSNRFFPPFALLFSYQLISFTGTPLQEHLFPVSRTFCKFKRATSTNPSECLVTSRRKMLKSMAESPFLQ